MVCAFVGVHRTYKEDKAQWQALPSNYKVCVCVVCARLCTSVRLRMRV